MNERYEIPITVTRVSEPSQPFISLNRLDLLDLSIGPTAHLTRPHVNHRGPIWIVLGRNVQAVRSGPSNHLQQSRRVRPAATGEVRDVDRSAGEAGGADHLRQVRGYVAFRPDVVAQGGDDVEHRPLPQS